MRSAIILAGGHSRRVGRDKGLLTVDGKTLIERVHDVAATLVQEVIVAVGSREQYESYSRLLHKCMVIMDKSRGGPLVGLWSALTITEGEAVLVLGCDMPLLSKEVLNLLFQKSAGHDAAIPRWHSGYIEPLHSVYRTDRCLAAAKKTLETGRKDFRSMISNLRDVNYVSVDEIQKLDRTLLTFFNVNTPRDLEKLRSILRTSRTENHGVWISSVSSSEHT